MNAHLRTALDSVRDMASGRGLAAAGRVESAEIASGVATVIVTGGGADTAAQAALQGEIEAAVSRVRGVTRVRVIFTAAREGRAESPAAPKPAPAPKAPAPRPAKRIIAVAAGKGGVGKSTVAANLAAAWVKQGLKVGLLDADVYGPSIPRLFGLTGAPGLRKTERGVTPLEAHGVRIVSMGFLVKPGEPVVWRGPMVQGALNQFLTETDWGDLDVLVIDMPPGTGDAQLAIAQTAALDGAVIACTPQDLALDDARKAMAMFEKTHTPLLGLIENMSVFLCPHCGEPSEIFGHGGAKAEAEAMGLPFLGEIPLTIELRRRSDEGRPLALDDGPIADAFARAARAVLAAADEARRPAPAIRFE